MRIAIDARLNAYRQGGIPQYTRQLMTALADVAREDVLISLQHRDHLRPLVVAPNVVRRTVYTPPHHALEQWTLPIEALLARPDVLHCPDFIAPMRRPFPAVVTIHDLAFLHYPQILDDAARAYYGQVKASALRADAVIAVSEATRQDVAQLLDVPAEQIDVIHEAAAPLYGRIELRPGEVRVLDGTPVSAGSFLLFVSTLEPRKNLPTLLKALRICIDRKPAAGYRLVVAGTRGWRDDEIFSTVRDLRLEDYVIFAPRVGQYDLRWLYNACRIYINPSLYEGFGLPLLEAMACGAPSLAAATSSLPEIGGDAAIYIPPLDAGLWADAIGELWDDDDRRAEMARRGRVQSQRFSWTRAARETLAVYRRAAERRPRPAEQHVVPPPILADADQTCPHCGSALTEGRVAGDATIAIPALPGVVRHLRPEALVCLSCGRVQAESASAAAAAQATEPLATVETTQAEETPAVADTLAETIQAEETHDVADTPVEAIQAEAQPGVADTPVEAIQAEVQPDAADTLAEPIQAEAQPDAADTLAEPIQAEETPDVADTSAEPAPAEEQTAGTSEPAGHDVAVGNNGEAVAKPLPANDRKGSRPPAEPIPADKAEAPPAPRRRKKSRSADAKLEAEAAAVRTQAGEAHESEPTTGHSRSSRRRRNR